MLGAQIPHGVLYERPVGGTAHLIGLKMVGVSGEVDRERTDVPVLEGQRGNRAGVEATRQQTAQRHIRHQLPFHNVLEKFAHHAYGRVEIVGVLVGLERPVSPLA